MSARKIPLTNGPRLTCCGEPVTKGKCKHCGTEYRVAMRKGSKDAQNIEVKLMLGTAGFIALGLAVLAIVSTLGGG